MNLKELKKPFETNFSKDLSKYNNNELVGMYLSTNSSIEKNKIVSNLMCESWGILQSLYYHNSKILSEEDCYEIFLQAFNYVVENHVWDNPGSTLYNDELAFMKAMSITVESRRKNFLKAKFRDKRIADTGAISLDKLEEDWTDGYFTQTENQFSQNHDDIVTARIKYYVEHELYLTALILEGIIYNNVFDEADNFDMRKLRKYLRNITTDFRKYFSNKYGCDLAKLTKATQFSDYTQHKLDMCIISSFTTLKYDDIIKRILDK